jgi:hypothetical protein
MNKENPTSEGFKFTFHVVEAGAVLFEELMRGLGFLLWGIIIAGSASLILLGYMIYDLWWVH